MKRSVGMVVLAVVLSVPVLAQNQSQPTQYTYQTIDYPESTINRMLGINNRGEITGHFTVPPKPAQAVLYYRGNFHSLNPAGVLGSDASSAWDINDCGDIVGRYVDDLGISHGFLLYQDGRLLTLDVPFPSIGTLALGINASGVVVGTFYDPNGILHGFIYSNGEYQQIDVPGAVDTVAFSINARGDIVGDWDTDPSTYGHGFVFSQGVFSSFDHPNAAPDSTYFVGINDSGVLTGLYFDAAGNTYGFVKAGQALTTLQPPGPIYDVGHLNSAGQLVGTFTAADGRLLGYLATPVPKAKSEPGVDPEFHPRQPGVRKEIPGIKPR